MEDASGSDGKADYTQSFPGPGPKKERLKPRRAIHFLFERIKTHPEAYSPDLIECLAQPWWEELVHGDYIHPDFYQLLNHKNLAKELTEAWASYLKVKNLLLRLNLNHRVERPTSAGEDERGTAGNEAELYLFDMCSGKGFNVFLITKMLPGRFHKIYAIDKDQKMNLEHFNALDGVKFKYADVHHRRFNEWIARKLGADGGNEGNRKARRHRKWLAEQQRSHQTSTQQQEQPTRNEDAVSGINEQADEAEAARREEQRRKRSSRLGLFLGVHLCGELSQTFVGLYNSTPGLAGMVLSPCCLPKHDRGPVERAKKLGLDSYSYWALQLYLMVGPGPLLTYKDLSPMEDVLSTKNAFITSIKRPFAKHDWKPDHHHPHHQEPTLPEEPSSELTPGEEKVVCPIMEG